MSEILENDYTTIRVPAETYEALLETKESLHGVDSEAVPHYAVINRALDVAVSQSQNDE